MGIFEFIIALVSIVLGVITVWMLMFHKQWFRSDEKIDPKGDYDLRELSSMAESMKERIDVLESILDAEVPNWREQNEREQG
ncbi:MAG: envelope stress response membrane protein PspB [Pseudohongiellaceae bacterium]|jgi:phage shock protein B